MVEPFVCSSTPGPARPSSRRRCWVSPPSSGPRWTVDLPGRALLSGRLCCAGDSQPLVFDGEGRPRVASSFDDQAPSAILFDTGALYTLLSAQTAASVPYLGAAAVSTGACSING